jgi:c(7)-type cytochrome triheme protein
MRILILLIILIAVAGVGIATAIPPGRTIEMKSGPMYKVILDGNTHVNKAVQCNECHPKLFKMKNGSTKVPAPHRPGEYCGVCHDGKRAFNQADHCGKCHQLET